MTYTKFPQGRQEGVDGLGNPSPQSPEFTGAPSLLMHLRALGVRFWLGTDGPIREHRELSPADVIKLMQGGGNEH